MAPLGRNRHHRLMLISGRAQVKPGVRVALVTCADLPELTLDDQRLLAPLAARGVRAEPAVWDDPRVDWSVYDLSVLRSPWDYVSRRDEFVAWAASVPRLANPASVVAWNTDKRYLAELAAASVPIIPTTFVDPDARWTPPTAGGDYVIKPAVSVGSRDTGRYGPHEADLAVAHVRRLQEAGRVVIAQPFLTAVDTYGETALLFFADPGTGEMTFSHAIRKGPMLTGPDLGAEVVPEPVITARVPTIAERVVARQVLDALPGGLLYARVDLIPNADGDPILVEVELTEPCVFLEHDPDAADRFADAISGPLRGTGRVV
jgi:glutathione synthase/RimK-type ligase-like ATP-grasp enzyme